MQSVAVDRSSTQSTFLAHHQPPRPPLQPHMQPPTHTSPLSPMACHKGAAISQSAMAQDAASLLLRSQKERGTLSLCRYDTRTDTPSTPGDHPVSSRLPRQNALGPRVSGDFGVEKTTRQLQKPAATDRSSTPLQSYATVRSVPTEPREIRLHL